MAEQYGCRVAGIDLTAEYVKTGEVLCSWVGLGDRITLEQGDATATPYSDSTFDKACMMHVGMNIANKRALAFELHRVLRPGGRLGIYDIMRLSDTDLVFPVPGRQRRARATCRRPMSARQPWRRQAFVSSPSTTEASFALDFFAQLQARAGSAGSAPPLGLHILMGDTAPEKVRNMIENVSQNRIAPVELIAEKTA